MIMTSTSWGSKPYPTNTSSDTSTALQDGTWGTDTMTFQDDELSYALGKQGGTRWVMGLWAAGAVFTDVSTFFHFLFLRFEEKIPETV